MKMSRNLARCFSLSFLEGSKGYGTSFPSAGVVSLFFSCEISLLLFFLSSTFSFSFFVFSFFFFFYFFFFLFFFFFLLLYFFITFIYYFLILLVIINLLNILKLKRFNHWFKCWFSHQLLFLFQHLLLSFSSSTLFANLLLVITALHSSFGFFSVLAPKLLDGRSTNCLASCPTWTSRFFMVDYVFF